MSTAISEMSYFGIADDLQLDSLRNRATSQVAQVMRDGVRRLMEKFDFCQAQTFVRLLEDGESAEDAASLVRCTPRRCLGLMASRLRDVRGHFDGSDRATLARNLITRGYSVGVPEVRSGEDLLWNVNGVLVFHEDVVALARGTVTLETITARNEGLVTHS